MTITAIELRSAIALWLVEHLGKYTFKSGQQSLAIAVLPDNTYGFNYPPAGTSIAGLEVSIVSPVPATTLQLGQDLRKRYGWEVYLKQWSPNAKIAPAVEVLVDHLVDNGYQFSAPLQIPPKEGLGIIGQVRLQVYEFEVRTHA